jgi:hypothetical protein
MSAAISCQLRIADSSSTNSVSFSLARTTKDFRRRDVRQQSRSFDSDKPVVQLNQLVISQEQLKQIREARRAMLKDGGEAR